MISCRNSNIFQNFQSKTKHRILKFKLNKKFRDLFYYLKLLGMGGDEREWKGMEGDGRGWKGLGSRGNYEGEF